MKIKKHTQITRGVMISLYSRICAFLHYRLYIKIYEAHLEKFVISLNHYICVKKIKQKKTINIVFFPMNVAMWKYQGLYDLLKENSRFMLYIVLAPASTFSYESRCKDLQEMRKYFGERDMPFIDYELEQGKEPVDLSEIVEPDILFYTQPYEHAVDKKFAFLRFQNKLLCHAPYSFRNTNGNFFNDNMRFNNIAWKLYYPNMEMRHLAKVNSFNHGSNVVVSGYLSVDDYILPAKTDPWKVKDRRVKRIIWAPHFTIVNNVGFSQVSNFLNMADFMRDLALEYSNRVTIAFKPHPRLYSELSKHPEWGEKRASEYFNFWRNTPTTQLETGDFADLFKGSDAMIHDSGSFTIDYLYFGKPVLYDNPDVDAAKATANETAKAAYDVHYKVTCNDDIRRFIDDVVIAGNDPMKSQREEFYDKFLRPPGGKSVAKIIYDDFIKSLDI